MYRFIFVLVVLLSLCSPSWAADGDPVYEGSSDAVDEDMLKAVNAAVDEDIFTYESTTGDFEWHTPSELNLLGTIGSSTDNAVARWDGTGGDTLQDSANFVVSDDGDVTVGGGIELEDTTSSTTGVITKGGTRFIHNFQHPSGDTAVPSGENTFMGKAAGNFTLGSTATETWHGSFNVAFGDLALNADTTGFYNTAIGYEALENDTDGHTNTGVGIRALHNNTSGTHNTAIGGGAIETTTTGSRNTGVGVLSLAFNTEGTDNTAMGARALFNVTTGDYNTVLGYSAGEGITTGNNNTIIGAQVTGLSSSLSNNVIIADGAGNQRIRVDSSGKVGIGTASPGQLLDVAGYVKSYYLMVRSAAPQMRWYETDGADSNDYIQHSYSGNDYKMQWRDDSAGSWSNLLYAEGDTGNVGINTTSPNQPLTVEGTMDLKEQAAANASSAGYGQIWVKNDAPNTLYFTDDGGTDYQIGSGDVSGPGSSTDNAVVRWDGAGGDTLQDSDNFVVSDNGSLVMGDNTANVDMSINFYGNDNSGQLVWNEDSDYFQFSDDILMLTTEKLSFRNTDLSINSAEAGKLTYQSSGHQFVSNGSTGLEIRDENGGGTPFIDFSNDGSIDYDARIILGTNDALTVNGANFNVAAGYALQCGGTSACDYVFEADYEVETLDELADYINENTELPGITFDNTDTLKVREAITQLLEETEEQAIYILQLHDRTKYLWIAIAGLTLWCLILSVVFTIHLLNRSK